MTSRKIKKSDQTNSNDGLELILKHLAYLNAAELQQLKGRVSALLSLNKHGTSSLSVTTTSPANHDAEWIVHCITVALEHNGLGCPNMRRLRDSDDYQVFCREEIPLWLRFLERSGIKGERECRHITLIAYNCMIEELRDRRVPVSPHSLMRSLDRLPGVLDRAFPGYARGGALPCVVGRWDKE